MNRGGTRRRKDGRCPCRADFEGAGDTRLLRPGYVLRSDSAGEGDQAGDRSERHLRHPAKTGDRDEAGIGVLARLVLWCVRNGLLDD